MFDKFIDWYVETCRNVKTAPELLNSFLEYLRAEGFSLLRGNLGTKTLHPQVDAISYLWVPKTSEAILGSRPTDDLLFHSTMTHIFEKALLTEIRFSLGSLASDQFSSSPIQYIFTTKEIYYFSFLDHKGEIYPYPILKELAGHSPTAYLAIPIIHAGVSFGFMSLLTDQENGFDENEIKFLVKALNLVAVKWISILQSDLTTSLLGIYLGKITGSLVTSGKIHRGNLEKINSVIWFSDIRNYSGMSEKLTPEEIIHLLNDYFGTIIPVIEKNGGEVLKMLGDGILAIFPYNEHNKRRVGFKSLIAVREAFGELLKLNDGRHAEEKLRIRHGVGLHLGEIMYGNIGSNDRLDFTVIGEAVNLTSRIAGMCGELGKAVLASEEFAEEVGVKWENIGKHKLKGITLARKIFGIPEELQMEEYRKKR